MGIFKNLFGTGTVAGEQYSFTHEVKPAVLPPENLSDWQIACRKEIMDKFGELSFELNEPRNLGSVKVKLPSGEIKEVHISKSPDGKYAYTMLGTPNDGMGPLSRAKIDSKEVRPAYIIGMEDDLDLFMHDRFNRQSKVEFKMPEDIQQPIPVTVTTPRGTQYHVTVKITYNYLHRVHVFTILEDALLRKKRYDMAKDAASMANEWIQSQIANIFAKLTTQNVVSIPAKEMPDDPEVLNCITKALSQTGRFEMVEIDIDGNLWMAKLEEI